DWSSDVCSSDLALVSVLTQRLVDQKISIGDHEIERARIAVEQQINATGSANSVQVRINSARASLTQLTAEGGESHATYEPVIVVENSSGEDRKSTRLNSSHVSISYAVFCLKKKKKMDKLTSM